MKTPVLALGIAVAAFASSSLYLWGQLRAERATLARVEDATRQLNARIAELEKGRLQTTNQHSVNSGGFIAGRFGPGAAPAPPPVVMPTPGADAEGLSRWMAESPKPPAAMEKAMRSQIRANNRQQYGDFCEEVDLDKETTDKLIALLSEQDAGFFHTSSDPAELRRQLQQLHRQHEAEISDLIGPEKAQALKQYQASLPARAEVEMLAQQLDGNDVPLNKDQRNRLQEVFTEERARVPMPELGPGDDAEQYLRSAQEWQDDFSRRVGERANHILNSEQLAVYNEIQQWQNQMRDGGAVAMSAAGYSVITSDMATLTLPATAVAVPAPSEPPKKKD